MKLISLLILGLALGQVSFAGDAGYFSRTCVSSSQRTVLTVLNDYSNGSPIYTLTLDGVPAVFNLSDPSVKTSGDDALLTVSKNNANVFKMDFNQSLNRMVVTVYEDARKGTIAEHSATPTPFTVTLKCKDFWPNP